jgi:hypothetical protein
LHVRKIIVAFLFAWAQNASHTVSFRSGRKGGNQVLNINDLTEDMAQQAILQTEVIESIYDSDPETFFCKIAQMNHGNLSDLEFKDWLAEEAKFTTYVARQVEIAIQNEAFYGE